MKYINIEPIINNVLEIKSEGDSWDLRNDADFMEVCYNVIEKSATLIWKFPSDWYIKEYKKKPQKVLLKLIFETVEFFEVDSSDIYGLKSDNIVIEGVNDYYEKKDGSFENNNFITFEFGNGLKIILKSEMLRFKIDLI